MAPDGDGVVITLKDVYQTVLSIKDAVAPLAGYARALDDHEKRLRSLERWRYSVPTAHLVSAGSLITAVITLLTKK